MNGRMAIAGLCMLCALLVSAFATQSASAITGTTAFTCATDAPTIDRDGAHCLNTEAPNTHGHKSIAQDTTTELTGTNANTANNTTEPTTFILKTVRAGVPVELSATGAAASGTMENKVAGSGEHYAHGEGTKTYTGVTVKAPAGRGCRVTTHKEDGSPNQEGEEGVVHTRPLTGTTEGQGDNLKVQPAIGSVLARFFVTCEEGKKIPAIENTWTCEGSVKGVPEGATLTFTHAATTAQGTLKCNGSTAGIEGKTTFSGRTGGGVYTPLAATTVTT